MDIKPFLRIAVLLSALMVPLAHALPILQIGPDPSDTAAIYDTGTQTWMFDGASSFSFNVYTTGQTGLTAYIVLAAVPMVTTDEFNVTVSDDVGTLAMTSSGYGTPPFEDPNSLAPHGIYDTWSEIYQVGFDGTQTAIGNTQPGDSGTGLGYWETITVDISSLNVSGIHIDLFTADYNAVKDKNIVTAFAPFSHDGQYVSAVPVPAALWLFGSGLLGLIGVVRRKHASPGARCLK